MANRRDRLTALAPWASAFAVLALATLVGVAMPAAAQGTVDVAIYTVENGAPAYDACYVIVGYSEVGCDENGDGKVTFAAIPYGSYTVRQTANLGSGRSVADFTITVTGNINGEGYEGFTATIAGSGGSSGFSDIAIVTTENGQPVYDACYVIVDYSEIGCDENRDGKITFEAIPYGTWTVHQTANLGPGRAVADFTITVTGAASGDGWERFNATVGAGGGAAGAKNISLITRDPDTGALLTGTCYVLLDYSNEGCDENGDGQVTFDAIPVGTWTVRQTRTPAGYATIRDFPITVDAAFPQVPVGYLVRQAPEQNASGTRNVSFVFVDSATGTKIAPTPVCLVIGTVSEVGCDDDLPDGQIDFLDVQLGTHTLAVSNLPAAWQITGGGSVSIAAGTGPQIVYLQVERSGATGSGTIAGQSGSGPSGASSDGVAVELSSIRRTA